MEGCHTATPLMSFSGNTIALIGHPNVGKSALFQWLTGRYVAISNYPGTTIELAQGPAQALPGMTVIDTPGVVALPSRTEDEQVTARVLLDAPLRAIVQVGDAKNTCRTLLLTVQLAEMGVPLILALNMLDEAAVRGVVVDHQRVAGLLAIPVIPTIAIRGEGVEHVVAALQMVRAPELHLRYADSIEAALTELEPALPAAPIAPRALGLLWLSGDPVVAEWLRTRLDNSSFQSIVACRDAVASACAEPLATTIQRTRLGFVEQVLAATVRERGGRMLLVSRLGQLATHPFWGIPILAAVLYALYWFVGVFGAGILVGLLEERLFGEMLNPWITEWVQHLIPLPLAADVLVGEYGLWTMGMTYALALLLPIVTTFFLAFGVLEDSGYLPRLAVLSNRLFRFLGLNGKAVLPMVLGLGCVTMATMTTRILESKRERLLVILLLALAVPCSAQLGVVMGMLASISLMATLIWAGVVAMILLVVGWLAARLVPGERSALIVELPPLRWPRFSNVLLKTLARLEWYVKEALPLFLVGTAFMFALNTIGILPWLMRAGEPLVVGWLGLPPEASAAFLLGFLRRDFAATGLFIMQAHGALSPAQVVVAMVTLTLFIPCIASVMMIAKERGARTAVA
ncbi:MAG TPA: ferrous iron transport protein B, partial [Roseiflexaceae bacterium]|nr:ferrous iron transport protein B [Roseiflexaceae bacterium]